MLEKMADPILEMANKTQSDTFDLKKKNVLNKIFMFLTPCSNTKRLSVNLNNRFELKCVTRTLIFNSIVRFLALYFLFGIKIKH